MLWLSIHLPRLPLEVFGNRPDEDLLAVLEGPHILLSTPAAERAGVRAGMRLTAAQALCPQLIPRERDTAAEQRTINRLAGWGLQFTPTVTAEKTGSVLLEVGASLNYFRGLDPLLEQVRSGLDTLGYQHRLGIAPTPTAAWLLSVAGDERPVLPGQSLDRRLGPLPVTLLIDSPRQDDALNGLGVETIADCLALPRAGLARRLGRALLERLDRALGRRADPRKPYRPPLGFGSHIELPAEVMHTDRLGFALNRLIRELCGFLRGTGSGVQRLQIALDHRQRPATVFELGTLAPSRDPEHLMALLRERLERVELSAPIVGLGIEACRLQHLEQQPIRLLTDDNEPGSAQHWRTLLERLSARLGEPRIRGLGIRSEHRPEYAWRYAPPGQATAVEDSPERPLWLFPQPEPLDVVEGRPVWHGPLVLERGPECIESGWWDGEDVRRDYYVAANSEGSRVWIFRERRPPGRWFLHGLFG